MRISILILTHKRPQLFSRCLESVLKQLPPDVEIIVNNDSNDIVEVVHPQVKYHYNKFDTLCGIYKFLLEQSLGDYVYYLEDDDYLNDGFFNIPLDTDLVVGNYYPTYTKDIVHFLKIYKDNLLSSKDFIETLNIEDLQLSQHIFKRQSIIDFDFQMDNNIHNDIRLVLHSARRCSNIRTLSKVLYFQTIDGKDNISFGFPTDVKITQSLGFMKEV